MEPLILQELSSFLTAATRLCLVIRGFSMQLVEKEKTRFLIQMTYLIQTNQLLSINTLNFPPQGEEKSLRRMPRMQTKFTDGL